MDKIVLDNGVEKRLDYRLGKHLFRVKLFSYIYGGEVSFEEDELKDLYDLDIFLQIIGFYITLNTKQDFLSLAAKKRFLDLIAICQNYAREVKNETLINYYNECIVALNPMRGLNSERFIFSELVKRDLIYSKWNEMQDESHLADIYSYDNILISMLVLREDEEKCEAIENVLYNNIYYFSSLYSLMSVMPDVLQNDCIYQKLTSILDRNIEVKGLSLSAISMRHKSKVLKKHLNYYNKKGNN